MMNKEKAYKINVTNYKCDRIPQVELSIVNPETDETVDTFWLSAFRWYRFQVSGDDNGSGDYGSTPVFGLETFGRCGQKGPSNLSSDGVVKFLIEAAMEDAVMEFMFGGSHKGYYMWEKPRYKSLIGSNPYWDKMIDDVYGYTVMGIQPENVESMRATEQKQSA